MARLAKLLFPLAVVTLGEDPCKGMTVADCEISEDNIISRYKSHEITFFKLEIRLSHMRCFLVTNLANQVQLQCCHLRETVQEV